jgi:hypothetical protein
MAQVQHNMWVANARAAVLSIIRDLGAAQVRFNFSAISTRRRSASERDGLSGWRLAHASTSAVNSGGARNASIGSLPVAGRPRFLGITFLLDCLTTAGYYPKSAGR